MSLFVKILTLSEFLKNYRACEIDFVGVSEVESPKILGHTPYIEYFYYQNDTLDLRFVLSMFLCVTLFTNAH